MNIKFPKQFNINVPEKYLVIVNKEFPIPNNYLDINELVSINNCDGTTFYMEKHTAKAFLELKSFLETKKVYIDVCSAFRTIEEQKKLFDVVVEVKGEEYAEKYVAIPMCSEHHTGLAIDLMVFDGVKWIDDESSIFERKVLENISKYFHLYGFILRYPMGKEEKTKINYEPWHIRYVGKDAATVIYNNGSTYCMEDFL